MIKSHVIVMGPAFRIETEEGYCYRTISAEQLEIGMTIYQVDTDIFGETGDFARASQAYKILSFEGNNSEVGLGLVNGHEKLICLPIVEIVSVVPVKKVLGSVTPKKKVVITGAGMISRPSADEVVMHNFVWLAPVEIGTGGKHWRSKTDDDNYLGVSETSHRTLKRGEAVPADDGDRLVACAHNESEEVGTPRS